jgi:hypothetical protein
MINEEIDLKENTFQKVPLIQISPRKMDEMSAFLSSEVLKK